MADPELLAKLRQGVAIWNYWRAENPNLHPDLRGADLSGADLRKADLSGAYLSEAYLGGADLRGAHLVEADLRGAQLSGVQLSGADLSGADLSDARLRRTDLRGVHLRGADLRGADLSEAYLSEADIRGADLSGVHLRGADLSGADLSDANLTESDVALDQLRAAKRFEFLRFSGAIHREIEFPPELRNSGVSLLNYFSAYLEDKYPDDQVTVRIQQRGRKVRMEIEPPEGKRDTVEKELYEYGLVVIGEKAPAQVLDNPFHIMKLENKLELALTELRMMQRLLAQQETTTEQFADIAQAALGGKRGLDDAIRAGLQITVNPENHIHVNAKASTSVAVDASSGIIERETPKLLAELEERLQDPGDRAKAADHVGRLAKQAKLPPLQRQPKHELEADWNALEKLAQAAGIVGSAAGVWQTWGAAISKAFGF